MKTHGLLLLVLWTAPLLHGESGKRVLMITDAEGVAGICRQEQAESSSSELQELLTGEINAAVSGFLSAGAEEVVVWDGHGGSRTLSVRTIHPEARLVIGSLGPKMLMDRGFAAVAFVGQHARANSSPAVMAHSYSSLGIQRILMNGKEVGEIETRSALAGVYGVPVIFLSGDQAAADDLHEIVPGAEVAVVKESLSYYSCISMSADAARELIETKAAAAFSRLAEIPPYRVNGPVTFEVEYTTRNTLSPESPLAEGIDRIGPRTLRFAGSNFMEAWTLFNMR